MLSVCVQKVNMWTANIYGRRRRQAMFRYVLERYGSPLSNGALHEELRRRDRIRLSHGPQRLEVYDMGPQMGVMKRSTCRD